MSEKTILLDEDEQYQVTLAVRAQRRHGIVEEVDEVVVAGDGEEALGYLFGEGSYADRITTADGWARGPRAAARRRADGASARHPLLFSEVHIHRSQVPVGGAGADHEPRETQDACPQVVAPEKRMGIRERPGTIRA